MATQALPQDVCIRQEKSEGEEWQRRQAMGLGRDRKGESPAERERHRDPGPPDPELEAVRGREEEREEEEVGRPEPSEVRLSRHGEPDRDPVEEARLVLDDVARGPAEHREGVHDRDDQRDEGHPGLGLEVGQEPEGERREGGELREVGHRGGVDELEGDSERGEPETGEEQPLRSPERQGEVGEPEHRRDDQQAEKHDFRPEREIRKAARDRVVHAEHDGEPQESGGPWG